MPTTKKRINISVSDEVESAVAVLAERDNVPQATKVVELLKSALETEEDQVLDQIARERDTESATFVSHEEAWK